jgi:hypothetical protein
MGLEHTVLRLDSELIADFDNVYYSLVRDRLEQCDICIYPCCYFSSRVASSPRDWRWVSTRDELVTQVKGFKADVGI